MAGRILSTATGAAAALAGTGADLALLASLVTGAPGPVPLDALLPGVAPGVAWLVAHGAAATLAGTGVALLAAARSRTGVPRWLVPCVATCAALPFVGGLGLGIALLAGIGAANASRGRTPYWQTIEPVALPFAAPRAREVPRFDERGLGEQLRHSTDADTLYRRVLAAGSMRDSLSIGALKAAVAHGDDRIRLTAYQMVDAKATRLNREIQRLEAGIERLGDAPDGGPGDGASAHERSTAWLQVAANYRELLTLEEAEPVARRQLLDKACAAAARAVEALPTSRSAHFMHGRLALLNGDLAAADASLERAIELGMSPDTVAPRLAESAFVARDFGRVRELLGGIDPAHRAWPPLRQVAEHWA